MNAARPRQLTAARLVNLRPPPSPAVFPQNVRGPASAAASLVNWTCAFAVTVSFASMSAAMGQGGVFFFFAGVCLAAAIFVHELLPETKGKSLEEIAAHFGQEGEAPAAKPSAGALAAGGDDPPAAQHAPQHVVV